MYNKVGNLLNLQLFTLHYWFSLETMNGCKELCTLLPVLARLQSLVVRLSSRWQVSVFTLLPHYAILEQISAPPVKLSSLMAYSFYTSTVVR